MFSKTFFTTAAIVALTTAPEAVEAQTFPNCGTSVRKSWRDLTCTERTEYLDAVKAIKSSGVYDEFSAVHFENNPVAHNTPRFLPWHRWFLWLFEKQLQEATQSCVTIPYWDWTMDSNGDLGDSSVFSADSFGTKTPDDTVTCVPNGIAGPVATSGAGSLDPNLDGGEWRHNIAGGGGFYNCGSFAANPGTFCQANIAGQFPSDNGLLASEACCTCRTAGFPNAGVTVNGQCQEINVPGGSAGGDEPWRIGAAEQAQYGLSATQCLSRQFRSNSVPQYGEAEAMAGITSLANADYTAYEQHLEGTPHALPHNWIGWLMSTHNSPQDPLFWLHHAQVDRLWTVWQDYQDHEGTTQVTSAHVNLATANDVLAFEGAVNLDFRTPAGNTVTAADMAFPENDLISTRYANDNLARLLIELDPEANGPRFQNSWVTVAADIPADNTDACSASRPTNPCLSNNGGCDPNTSCTNLDGFPVCGLCPEGMTGHGATACSGTPAGNPCETNNGGCDAAFTTCVNNNGVAVCADINECAVNNGGCNAFQTCNNNNGAAPTCVDINECAVNNGNCGANSVCTNNDGAAQTCACVAGFESADGRNCVDINECATNNGGCNEFYSCVNTVGGSNCVDINECLTNNGGCSEFETCNNQVGNAPTCSDINECAVNNGGCGDSTFTTCINRVGATNDCQDIDECAFGNGPCNEFTTCVNNVAASATCEPIVMCATNYCDSVGPAAFTQCVERPGFAPECLDIKECAVNNGNCGPNAVCVENDFAAPTCECASGFTGADCAQDINECATNNGGCSAFQTCVNSVGSFTCEDIDECATNNGGCSEFEFCVNNDNAAPTCSDTNECLVNNGNCGDAALFTCVNQVGALPICRPVDACDNVDCGAFSTCNAGVCEDINECTTNNGGCDATFETCVNNNDAAPTCVDIDECATNNGGCNAAFFTCADNVRANPTCVPRDLCAETTPCNLSFFTCQNNNGAAPTCVDIAECASNNGDCGPVANFECQENVGAAPTCVDITPAEPAWVAMQAPLLDYYFNRGSNGGRAQDCPTGVQFLSDFTPNCLSVYRWFISDDCRDTGIGSQACLAHEAGFPAFINDFPTTGAGRRLLSLGADAVVEEIDEVGAHALRLAEHKLNAKRVAVDAMLLDATAVAPQFQDGATRERFMQLKVDYPTLTAREIVAIVADEHCQARGRQTGITDEWMQMNNMSADQFECRFH